MIPINPDVPKLDKVTVFHGDVVTTPRGAFPYKVVFRHGKVIASEHWVNTVAEGEALIKAETCKVSDIAARS